MLRYVETFFRHRLLFAVPVILVLLVSGGVVLTQPVVYTATTRLWVDKPVLGDTSNNNPFVSPAAEQSDTLTELLNTRYFTVRVARRGPLAAYLASQPIAPGGLSWVKSKVLGRSVSGRLPGPDEVDAMAYDLLSGGKNVIAFAAGPQIIEVDFTYTDPRVASGTAQAIIDQFLEETLTSGKARAQVSVDFYSSQLKQVQDNLAAADNAVNQYLGAHPEFRAVNAVPDARLTALQRADQQARDALTAMQQQVDTARLNEAALAAPGASGMRLLDPATVPAQAAVSKKLIVEALGAGLGVGALIVVLGLLVLTLADTTLRRPDEVEQALGLRLAGSVPRLRA